MYRELLEKCRKGTYVFLGTPTQRAWNRLLVKDVTVMDTNENVLGTLDHVLTNIKPFNGKCSKGEECRFTGKVYKYTRKDGSEDYSITVNKVKKYDKNNKICK